MMSWIKLQIHEALWRDVYKDTVRIHQSHRDGIKAGTICRIKVMDGGSALVVVRGLTKENEINFLRADDVTRERLGFNDQSLRAEVKIRLRKAYLCEKL